MLFFRGLRFMRIKHIAGGKVFPALLLLLVPRTTPASALDLGLARRHAVNQTCSLGRVNLDLHPYDVCAITNIGNNAWPVTADSAGRRILTVNFGGALLAGHAANHVAAPRLRSVQHHHYGLARCTHEASRRFCRFRLAETNCKIQLSQCQIGTCYSTFDITSKCVACIKKNVLNDGCREGVWKGLCVVGVQQDTAGRAPTNAAAYCVYIFSRVDRRRHADLESVR